MKQETFEQIAEELDGTYKYAERRHVSLVSRNIPTVYHHLRVHHKEIPIDLVYEFGGQNMCTVKSSFRTRKDLAPFEITSRGHVERLFSRDKDIFKVKCDDEFLKFALEGIMDLSAYLSIAEKTVFEPKIQGESQNGEYVLKTSFYLGFDEKEEAIIPSIDLHKRIIDKTTR